MWAGSLCANLDRKAVAAIFSGQPRTAPPSVSTWAGDPTFDMCGIPMSHNGRNAMIFVGTSVLSYTKERFTAAVTTVKAASPHVEAFPGREGGYFLGTTGVALVGDRAVRVAASFAMTTAQADKLMDLVAPKVASAPLPPLNITDPRCDDYTSYAASIIGEDVLIHRAIPTGGEGVECVWAGPSIAAKMRVYQDADAVQRVRDEVELFQAQPLLGLGKAAAWTGNPVGGYQLVVASATNHVIDIEAGFLQRAEQEPMRQLAQAVLARY